MGPTFAFKPADIALAQGSLFHHSAKWDSADVLPPGLDGVACAFKRGKHSAPGLDGLPYCEWVSAGTFGIQTLYLVMLHPMGGLMMPVGSKSSLVVFVPEGEEPDELSIVREPCDTRSLSLKNCDNKMICAVVNFALRIPLATHACSVERGFIPGRQLVSSVVDFDVHGRIYGSQPVDSDPSLISLYDFAAAFPSMSHTWIAACPTALGIPSGAHDLIMSMCRLSLAHSAAGGALIPLFLILSGVLLGCPLSGFLFAVGVDPFVWWVYKVIELAGLWKIRVCADDTGTALENISALLVLYPISAAIERAAGPSLKPSKCVLAPTGHEFTPELVSVFKTWLQLNIPEWACFEIKSAGKYLGFWLGPKAASLQWIRTLDKYSCRTQLAADTGSAASVSVLRYNSRALPALGYISQLLPLPPWLAKLERKMLYRVLRCPLSALSFHPLFRPSDAGVPRTRSASVLAAATRLRAATTTVPHWQSLLRELRDAAEQFLPLGRALSGRRPSFDDPGPFAPVDAAWWTVCWDDKPFAWYLGEAADFFPRAADADRALHAGYDALLDAARSGSGLQATAARLLHGGIPIGSLAGVVDTRLRSLFPAPADRLSLEYVLGPFARSDDKKLVSHSRVCAQDCVQWLVHITPHASGYCLLLCLRMQ